MDDTPTEGIDANNFLCDLAERVKETYVASERAREATIERMLECGRLLISAKQQCSHGQWLPFLERSGVPARYSQRAMRLAEAGFDMRHVSHLGGIRAALEFLAEQKMPLPARDQAIFFGSYDDDFGLVWEARDFPGYYHFWFVRRDDTGGGQEVLNTRAMSNSPVTVDGCTVGFFNYVMRDEMRNLTRETVPFDQVADLVGRLEKQAEQAVMAWHSPTKQ